MFLAVVAGMSGVVAFPALIPSFQAEWGLTNTQSGIISGIYFAGYAAAVPVLTGLTDRIDPRRVVLAGMGISIAASLGFAVGADGAWSAGFWRVLHGVGFAGIYMPAIKALSDTVEESQQGRAVTFVSAAFSAGFAVSYLSAGALAEALGWRWAFAWLALGPALGYLFAAWALPRRPPAAAPPREPLMDIRPALRNRRALAYMVAYFVHNSESSAMRAWAVSFLVLAQAGQATASFGWDWSPTVIAMAANFMGLPAILLANEVASATGRRGVIMGIMAASALTGLVLGFLVNAPFILIFGGVMVYGFVVTADAGTLNAALVSVTQGSRLGGMLGIHAMFGATGAALGPMLFGAVLDLAGGELSQAAWMASFAAMACLVTVGPAAIHYLDPPRPEAAPGG
jgi:MFS family permease